MLLVLFVYPNELLPAGLPHDNDYMRDSGSGSRSLPICATIDAGETAED